MARMYPKGGPTKNSSYIAEPAVYRALATQLNDDFFVIHSLPWLAQVAKEIDGRAVPLGEIDFLISHPKLGILVLEVKGEHVKIDNNYVVFGNGGRKDPLSQMKRGIFSLGKWIVNAGGPFCKFGYAVVFPQSLVKGRTLPPAFYDATYETRQCLCLDQSDLNNLGQKIIQLMTYWKHAYKNQIPSSSQINQIINLLVPDPDFTPTWMERISLINQNHLQLTVQQSYRLKQINEHSRYVLTGRSGTGKTLIAIERAFQLIERAFQLIERGMKVLFLVYNVALLEDIQVELGSFNQSHPDSPRAEVMNFHELCRAAVRSLRRMDTWDKEEWYKEKAHNALKEAVAKQCMPAYDALIIDEAQVFHCDWLKTLYDWLKEKPILACCDETQVFSYEHKTTAEEIGNAIHAS
ncbi:nuclease-related domain-containing DEAD/DEAH box helicase [Dictyobacter kobayashii]|uniref:NERD domain-containing protein n=1 Tax=Dictyobacter kobayashii TaxID=2014872 RepID=A0A402ANZ2_9CHLR|nr:NERD domain-containing protein [Dictyobacter kobayashii]GCE20883.1 hypothetical protein KDK_46830 [Dictyobacter kobayashii]